MGKIWLSGPDSTSSKKCCGCAGKTGPCSPCCNCGFTEVPNNGLFTVFQSGIYTLQSAALSRNAQSVAIGISSLRPFLPANASLQEAATRTILAVSVTKGETINITSAYSINQHYYAKPQYASSFGFDRTAAYAVSLKCGSSIGIGIPCEAVKGVEPALSTVFTVGGGSANTIIPTAFSEVMTEPEFDCTVIASQVKIELLQDWTEQNIKRNYRRDNNFGIPSWNFAYPGYDPSSWVITNTSGTIGYDPFDNVPETDRITYPDIASCEEVVQALPDPAGYPEGAIVNLETDIINTVYRAYRREYTAALSMTHTVTLTAKKTCCITIQFDGYPVANNEQNFFVTEMETDTSITAAMTVTSSLPKLNIVEMKCQDLLGNKVPCP